jgi:hypothetical protein
MAQDYYGITPASVCCCPGCDLHFRLGDSQLYRSKAIYGTWSPEEDDDEEGDSDDDDDDDDEGVDDDATDDDGGVTGYGC